MVKPYPMPEPPVGELWVFAYGSLMWNPGFPHVEACRARLYGYHRSLCVWSWVYRGTRRAPGLVLGLDRGGSCPGIAYRVPGAAVQAALGYLAERELITGVYRPLWKPLRIDDGRRVSALAFVVDRGHLQYAGKIPERGAVATIRGARGRNGANLDYVANTVAHLELMGIPCRRLRGVLDGLRVT